MPNYTLTRLNRHEDRGFFDCLKVRQTTNKDKVCEDNYIAAHTL